MMEDKRAGAGFLEQDVVVGVGVERRVEIDKVNAAVGEGFAIAQPFEVVAEEQPVHPAILSASSAASNPAQMLSRSRRRPGSR